MNAIDYLKNCSANFDLDTGKMIITTPVDSSLTHCGCGYDQGFRWYYKFPAEYLLVEINMCLMYGINQSQIIIEGTRHECDYEIDGGIVAGDIDGSERKIPVAAKFELDLLGNTITYRVIK